MFRTTRTRTTSTGRRTLARGLASTGGLLAVGLLLAACGDGSDTTQTGAGHDQGSMGSSSAMPMSPSPGVTRSATPAGTPAAGPHNAVDVMFATGMVPHHGQAVAMAELAEARASGAAVKDLAAAIRAAQGPEIEQLSGWLAGWGEPVPAADIMASGMDHDMGSMDGDDASGMGGMMSTQDMAALAAASGVEFDRLWLHGMVAHHQGAVSMSKVELKRGVNPDAKALAQRIITAQQSEITTLTELLAG